MKKSTKNILLVHSSNDYYGASKILLTIIDVLIKSGHSVYLILPENGPLNNHESLKNVNLSIINLGVFRKKYLNFFGLINRLFFIIKSIFQIQKILNKYEIELVYTNTSTVVSPTFAAYLSNVPSIFHIHEIPFGFNFYTKFLIKIFNLFPKKIIAVSNFTRDFWLNNGLKNEKISVIYNGFNFDFSTTKKIVDDKIIFTNISRIIPYKGHLFLIDLFNEILKQRSDVFLQIIGDTLPSYRPYYEKLKLKVNKYNIQTNVKFLGFRNDIKSFMKESNFFIHTPINPDPLPTVIFEAVESNIPVIFTDNGGAAEILDQSKNGLLIDKDSIYNSKELILNYINDLELQHKNTQDSVKYVSKKFSKELFNKKLTKLISSF